MKVGGQAVIEGVLMMGKKVVVAVRQANGDIAVKELGGVSQNNKWMKIPFIRGFFSLFYSLSFGLKAIDLSAELSSGEEMKKSDSIISILIAIVLALGLFIVAPAYITKWMGIRNNEFLFSLIDGFIRLGIFLLYVWIISLSKDIKRVFQYHGAEHKTVHNYESGEELSVENARKFSTIHPRCGTNFLMIFLLVAILVHSLFGLFGTLNMVQRILVRLIALPIVAGISYELLRLFDKYPRLRVLAAPGMLLQRLTTAQPDDSQLEVAIVSLKHALGMEDEAELVNKDDGTYSEVDKPVEFLG
ncbi:MAG TPA: DUF1385 domain-containing protein [Fervidobacterium sp.]|nr:DUF1385 domain-containing protein [Fervidobacterium sp.]MBP9518764.1 DUF1385 domain-containing protein [Fervidobacterium sp.]HCL98332.1 DUF1385 domain-containing protein [Fervidobacterium sp.]HOA17355.1 DUF1385 domain-containing protein [Fervidobacterium sp.]HOL03823.1 DUF1385 domain-containing protein [Fervidobacterium sp.]